MRRNRSLSPRQPNAFVLREPLTGLFTAFGGFDVAGGRRHAQAGDRCLYAKTDGSDFYQLYYRTLPLGSETQLTSYDDRHTAVPTLLPDGHRFICQREMPTHSDEGVVGTPGDGWYHNLVLGDIDTDPSTWTELIVPSSTTTPTEGVLWPVIRFDVSDPTSIPVAYNWIYSRDTAQVHSDYTNGIVTSGTYPFGKCHLRMATLDANGAAVSDITTLIEGPQWFEPQDWDGDTLLFASERPQAAQAHWPHNIALYTIDTSAGTPANTVALASRGGDAWEEFGSYLADGSIVYMSSRGLWLPKVHARSVLRARLWWSGTDRLASRVNVRDQQALFTMVRARGSYAYAELLTYSTAGALTAAAITRAQLDANPLPVSLATVNLSGARAAGNNWTQTANFHLRATITALPASGSVSFRLRRQDASNYWNLIVGSTGALTLFETVAGSPTQRATAAAVVTAGTIIDIIGWDNSIRGYSGGVWRWQYNSANNFKAATGGDINSLGTGGGVSDVLVWEYPLG